MDNGNECWLKREQIVDAIDKLPCIDKPEHAFHTVLNAEDLVALRTMVDNMKIFDLIEERV